MRCKPAWKAGESSMGVISSGNSNEVGAPVVSIEKEMGAPGVGNEQGMPRVENEEDKTPLKSVPEAAEMIRRRKLLKSRAMVGVRSSSEETSSQVFIPRKLEIGAMGGLRSNSEKTAP